MKLNHSNKPNIKQRFFLLLISFCLLVASFVPLSLAWFSPHNNSHDFSAHALIGYFESGDGLSEETAYVIATPKQFYYFSWLQFMNRLEDNVYIELSADLDDGILDMTGVWEDGKGITGAIPPIGTSDQPFTGHFNGNGIVIKNLWVSTDESDWLEHPASYEGFEVGNDVGLFGNVDEGANITNFYLENIEITTTVEDATLGVIAGHVNGSISNIGVKNAKLSFKGNSASQVNSTYSLIGEKEADVLWDDLPKEEGGTPGTGDDDDGKGGDLIINTSLDYTLNTYPQTNRKYPFETSGALVPIAGAEPGSAYMVGSLDYNSLSNKPNYGSTYVMKEELSFTSGVAHTVIAGNTNSARRVAYEEPDDPNFEKDQEFREIYYRTDENGVERSNTLQTLVPSDIPNFANVTKEGTYPTNAIWFKPINPGKCSIAFFRPDKGSANVMSIYRFLRDETTGAIKEGSLQEIVLNMEKTASAGSSLPNGSILCFTLDITDTNYEYVIGETTKTTGISGKTAPAGFIYLKLAGTDEDQGPDPGGSGDGEGGEGGTIAKRLDNIDFVESILVDLETMQMHRSVFTLSGNTQSTGGAIYFDAANGVVIYYNDSNLTMTQQIQSNVEAEPADSPEYFDPDPPGTDTGQ